GARRARPREPGGRRARSRRARRRRELTCRRPRRASRFPALRPGERATIRAATTMSPMSEITKSFLLQLPKTDLHVHLDGSLRLSTLLELAREQKVALPSNTEGGMREQVFKDRYASLAEYLRGFAYTGAVLQNEESLERVSYELAEDNQKEGVRYLEVRFAPQLHVHAELDAVRVLAAVDRGLRRARDGYNRRKEIVDGLEPPFEYGIICCAMRKFTPAFSRYYATLFAAHPYARPQELYSMASVELARASILARDQHGFQVVGFDLAGD